MTTKASIATIVLAGLLLAPWVGLAQDPKLEEHPGYIPLEEIALLPPESLSLEINLTGPILDLVASTTRREDPEFSRLVGGLLAVRVHVGPVAGGGDVAARVDRATGWLEKRGWNAIVRMRDGADRNYIYLKQDGKDFVGLTLVAIGDDDEAVLVNIVGRVDPEQLGKLAGRFDIPGLSDLSPAEEGP